MLQPISTSYILYTLLFFLVHHLMCWPDTKDNSFKLEETCLWMFSSTKKGPLCLVLSMKKDLIGLSYS